MDVKNASAIDGVFLWGIDTGRAVAEDQAALLAELYRAADYPARLVWGVQELSIDSLRDHFGLEGPQLENALTTFDFIKEDVSKGLNYPVFAFQFNKCMSALGSNLRAHEDEDVMASDFVKHFEEALR